MKKAFLILFGIAIFSSCIHKNPLIGTWIEQDNFINPAIYEIKQDYYRILNGPFPGQRIYKVKKDTFMFDNFFELEKIRFKIKEDELLFYSVDSDSLLSKFERNVYRNFIDYFNVKKNTAIMLPVLESKQISWDENINTIVFNNEDSCSVFFNGENIKFDSLTYLKFFPTVDEYLYGVDNNLIFCDSRLKLHELDKLKIELQKARRNRITYVTQDSLNNLMGLRVILPYLESNIPDSLKSKYPPPPPPPTFNLEDFHSENILCKIDSNKIVLNNQEVSPEKLYSITREKIQTIKGFVAHVYFDEKMDFESYLKELSALREVYYSVRNEYSHNKFNVPNYEDLESDRLREVQNLFFMRIREINKNEYEKLIKYAL
ncbi:hypothetical protein JXM83_05360 [Candidatus Woesearchaeota archaeon]|nr:hypothetical protein [Candidatus Woesearchaeota archaeon]